MIEKNECQLISVFILTMNYLQFKTITSPKKDDFIAQYNNIHFVSPRENIRRNKCRDRDRERESMCVCVCVCVRTTRGKSGCTTCTKYTIFSVKTGCTWLPLNLEESNIQVGTAILPFFNLFIRFKTNLSFSFIRLFRLREYYQLLPVLEISSFPQGCLSWSCWQYISIQFLRCLGLKGTYVC